MDKVNPKPSCDPTDLFEEDCEMEDDGSLLIIRRKSDETGVFQFEAKPADDTLKPSVNIQETTPDKKATSLEEEEGDEKTSDPDSIEEMYKLLSIQEETKQMGLQMKEKLQTMISRMTSTLTLTSDGTYHRETDSSNKDRVVIASKSDTIAGRADKSFNGDAAGEGSSKNATVKNEDLITDSFKTDDSPSKPLSNTFRKLTNLRRRRLQKLNQVGSGGGTGGFNFQEFILDYYTSLDKVSRYIIGASLLSFITAFVLLSLYSSQTHQHDMEFFKLKEKEVAAQQSIFEKASLRNENFRESLIHERYEETRECHTSLKMCNSDKDELLVKITELEKEVSFAETKWQIKLDGQQSEIIVLESRIRDLQETNRGLRSEIGQSFSSSYAQIVVGFLNVLRNRTTQIFVAAFVGISTFLLVITLTYGK